MFARPSLALSRVAGKTAEQIRTTFNIKNDFTPEEEEMVRKENEWCEDRYDEKMLRKRELTAIRLQTLID